MVRNNTVRVATLSIKRFKLLNRYYKITRFYAFLKDTAIKGGLVIVGFLAILGALEYFLLDFNSLLNSIVESFAPQGIISFFLLSETFFGLVPPEIFIAWASKTGTPWIFLFVLATISYIGGIIAYFIGKFLLLIPAIRNHIENKISQHIINLRKWGGLFVFVGATLPPPHSLISIACGLINYNFKHYLLWALFRYLRFIIYALVIFQIF